MQIHELNTYTGTPGDNDYLAIDDGQETSKIPATAIKPPNLPGIIQMYAGSTIPNGWRRCNGDAVSRTEYAELFAVIGTTYGSGDGSTTFNLPDMRNRFPVGAGDQYSRNAKGGAESVTLTTNQIPAHTHGSKTLEGTIAAQSYNNGTPSGIVSSHYTNFNLGAQTGTQFGTHTQKINATHTHDSVGGGASHENRPPYIGIIFIISTGK